jgi:hypothetical protein
MAGSDYERLIEEVADAIFSGAVLGASELRTVWQELTQQDHMSNHDAWTIQAELVFFLISTILRDTYTHPLGGQQARDAVQDDIVSRVIHIMLARSFDWTQVSARELPDRQQKQAEHLLRWYNEAELDYGPSHYPAPSEEDFVNLVTSGDIPEDDLAGKLARRVANATPQGSAAFYSRLILVALHLYNALAVPALAARLAQARPVGQGG